MNPCRAIAESGGKHGIELCLADAPETSDLIIPGDPFPLKELTAGKALQIMEQGDHDEWVIRTSHEGDWFGMIDLLPTFRVTRENVRHYIRQIFNILDEEVRKTYAQAEGWDLDPEKITVTIKPFIPGPHGTITDHPNHEGVFFVDRNIEDGCGIAHDEIESFVFKTDGEWHQNFGAFPHQHTDFLETAFTIRERVYETGLFKGSDVHQIEFVHVPGATSPCFQVRKIANRFPIEGEPTHRGYRQMVGTLGPIEGLVKNIHPDDFKKHTTSEHPIIFHSELRETPWFIPGSGVKGVGTMGNPSFTHGKVRVAHLALQNGGYAGFHRGPHELKKDGSASRVKLRNFHDETVALQWSPEDGEVIMLHG